MIIIADKTNIVYNSIGSPISLEKHGIIIELNNIIVRNEDNLIAEFCMLHYKSNRTAKYVEFIENIIKYSMYKKLLIIGDKYKQNLNAIRISNIDKDGMISLKRDMLE
jgi:hypothetical protein